MGCFRLSVMLLFGLLASALLTWRLIPVLQKLKAGQSIREDGPSSHLVKSGTPTMGGIAMIAATALVSLVFGAGSVELAIILTAFLLLGALGFADDYLKVVKKHNLGLRAWQKLAFQTAIGAAVAAFQLRTSSDGSAVAIPFANHTVDFGLWYIPFAAFVIVAMANSVNLTDGVDGLATGVTAIVAFFFAAVGGTAWFSPAGEGLGRLAELAVASQFCAALCGACLGFLLFNAHPAKIFMGDTGSLALGGGLAAAAIVMNRELFLPLVGVVYVAEALSVMIQVAGFKMTGKRVFKMAPLHHHFELVGLSEKKVAGLFWGVTLLFCGASLWIL